jgi:hypothetical protein
MAWSEPDVLIELAPADTAAWVAEDAEFMATDSRPALRTGVARPLAASPDLLPLGWSEHPGIGRFWRVELTSPDAVALRVHFSFLDLPDGVELWVADPKDPSLAQGPFRGRGPFRHGEIWSRPFDGESVVVECFIPESVALNGVFLIDELMHVYRHPLEPDGGGDGTREGPCHTDVSCRPEWHPLRNAVARIDSVNGGSSSVCCGTLLNNNGNDLSPLFVSAEHCVQSQASAESAVVYWFYQTPSCNGTPPALGSVPKTSFADLLVSRDIDTGSDFSLLLLRGELPGGLTWAGWDTGAVPNGTDVAGIHHPTGSFKRIFFGDKIAHPGGDTTDFWGLSVTSDGTVEFSTSGSGLFRVADQKYIGQASHAFVQPGCANAAGPFGYGKFVRCYNLATTWFESGYDDGLESNDTCQTATLLTPPTMLSDLVTKSTREDWFRIPAAACQRIDVLVSFTDAFGDIDIELYDACGGLVVASSSSTSNAESIQYPNGTSPRDYYLRVYLSSNVLNTYDLNVTLTALPPNECDASCPGDADGDRRVDNLDLQALLDAWASVTGDPNYDPGADFDDDGRVDNNDLQVLLDNWQRVCP